MPDETTNTENPVVEETAVESAVAEVVSSVVAEQPVVMEVAEQPTVTEIQADPEPESPVSVPVELVTGTPNFRHTPLQN